MIKPLPFFCANFNSDSTPSKDFLTGAVFTEREILLDTPGLELYKSKYGLDSVEASKIDEGRFLALLRQHDGFICKSDAFGQELIFYYNDGKTWAISNSLIYLAEQLRANDIKLDIYEPALMGFMVGSQSLFGGQLLSHRTPYTQIKLLPYKKQIRLKRQDKGFLLLLEDRPASVEPINNLRDYKDQLLTYVASWTARLSTLAHTDFSDRALELSGGYDSRVNFALAIASDALNDGFYVFSRPGKEKDFAAASGVTQEFGVSLSVKDKRPDTVVASASEEYELWRYGDVGSYLPIYQMRSSRHSNSTRVHGANYRGRSYVTKSVHARALYFEESLPYGIGSIVKEEFLGSFKEIGIDPKDPYAMQEHYTAFRCRIHYGRNWHWRFRTVMITPQLSPLIKSLTTWRTRSNDAHPEQTACDILTLIDKTLARLPFDLEEKAFPSEVLTLSDQLGISLANVPHFDIELLRAPTMPVIESIAHKQKSVSFRELIWGLYDQAKTTEEAGKIFGEGFLRQAALQQSERSLLKTGKINLLASTTLLLDTLR